jgi:hypothetical protein
MALSVRTFGLNSWSILVPQALAGVATVALVWDAVRRTFGDSAALIAGVVFALTPAGVAIFRHNNPDALLVLLLVAALWAALRAVDDGRTRWLVLCGVLVGFGYLTKQLAVVLVLPALFIPYLVAGPPTWLRRLWQVGVALAAAVLAGGWWVALVQLWPPDDRPWIGGSQHNSELELTFGYNGIGRISGHEVGAVGLPIEATTKMVHGDAGPGIGRLFQAEQIGQIAWLLACRRRVPGGAAGLALARAAPRRRTGVDPGVGAVAGHGRSRAQPHGRDLPSLLHGDTRSADRGAGGHRRRGLLAATHPVVGAGHPGRSRCGHRGDGIRGAAASSALPSVAAVGLGGCVGRAAGVAGAGRRTVGAAVGQPRSRADGDRRAGSGRAARVCGDDGVARDVGRLARQRGRPRSRLQRSWPPRSSNGAKAARRRSNVDSAVCYKRVLRLPKW